MSYACGYLQAKGSTLLTTAIPLTIISVENMTIESLLDVYQSKTALMWGPISATSVGLEECPQTSDYLRTFDVSARLLHKP